MKPRNTALALAGLVSLLLLATSCSNDDDDNPVDNPVESPFVLQARHGSLGLAAGSTIDADALEAVSFADRAVVGADGSFEVESPEADGYQVVFFNSIDSGLPVYLGLYDPVADTTYADLRSTALVLTLLNPYLIYTDPAQRALYLETMETLPGFDQLVAQLQAAHGADASKVLDYDEHPEIYQTTAELMRTCMEQLGAGLDVTRLEEFGDAPIIEDRAGSDIAFVNERHVHYVAGVTPVGGAQREPVDLARVEHVVDFSWGWPPLIVAEPAVTTYALGDGDFSVLVAMGMDFSRMAALNDPVGRATLYNTGQAIVYLAELVIGNLPIPDIAGLGAHLHIPAELAAELARDMARGEIDAFILHFMALVGENSEEIAYWIWQEYQADGAHVFMQSFSAIMDNVTLALRLLSFANEQGPFFWDLVFAPRQVIYEITQTAGVLVENQPNDPPAPHFDVMPPAGIVGTVFEFDASSTFDDVDLLADIDFRWDFEGDGVWDVDWSGVPTTSHAYDEAGSYTVLLEARDTAGLSDIVSHVVNVGGGAGTATHVKVFRDNLPWSSEAMTTMLQSLGFTEGEGEHQYEILASDRMDDVALIPGVDLVILGNDQNQTFYNNYASSQLRFNNFVYMGGSLFWEACDEGWANGSMANAGVVLPGNVGAELDYDGINTVTDQNLPLVAGLPDTMDHNYASHESFTNLLDGTTVYCLDSEGDPTLIEYNLGGGWVLMTGQPLEHQYDHIYGSPDMEQLLPRIVAYFTGQALPETVPAGLGLPAQRASH